MSTPNATPLTTLESIFRAEQICLALHSLSNENVDSSLLEPILSALHTRLEYIHAQYIFDSLDLTNQN